MTTEEVHITLNPKQSATMALTILRFLTLIDSHNMRDPVTDEPIPLNAVMDLAEIFELINTGVGNEPSSEFRELIQKINEKMSRLKNLDFFCDKVIAHGMRAGGHVYIVYGVCNVKICQNYDCDYNAGGSPDGSIQGNK